MEFPADSLRAALNDTGLMAAYGLTPANAMALFMDNTYEVYWTTSARDRMLFLCFFYLLPSHAFMDMAITVI